MSKRERCEAGDTLVEILAALVIIGLIVGAYLATIQTSAVSSKAQRDLVAADSVLRDYAESAKQSVRASCASGSTFTVNPSLTPPSGFTINVAVSVNGSTHQPFACPSVSTVTQVDLDETLPNGHSHNYLSVDVRTP